MTWHATRLMSRKRWSGSDSRPARIYEADSKDMTRDAQINRADQRDLSSDKGGRPVADKADNPSRQSGHGHAIKLRYE